LPLHELPSPVIATKYTQHTDGIKWVKGMLFMALPYCTAHGKVAMFLFAVWLTFLNSSKDGCECFGKLHCLHFSDKVQNERNSADIRTSILVPTPPVPEHSKWLCKRRTNVVMFLQPSPSYRHWPTMPTARRFTYVLIKRKRKFFDEAIWHLDSFVL
jgi:hypothetical protein